MATKTSSRVARDIASEFLGDGAGRNDRASEIAGEEIAHIDHELIGERPVEPVFVPDGLLHVVGGIRAGDQPRRIPRRDIGDDEGQGGETQHGPDQDRELAQGDEIIG